MLKMQKKSAPSTNKNDRRRGRPAGKNRTPLSLEERRARNAQYERERRNETADAMVQLAEAARCQPEISNADLLATVISQLRRRVKRKLPEDIEDLKRVNESLESQIADLQTRLGNDFVKDDMMISDNLTENEQISEPDYPKKDSKVRRCRKIRKISKCSSVREKSSSTSISGSNSSSDTSNASWSETQSTEIKYQLRTRSSKVSECATSTYLKSESEWSHSLGSSVCDQDSEKSSQSEARLELSVKKANEVPNILDLKQETEDFEDDLISETKALSPLSDSNERLNDPFLPAIPELEDEDYTYQSETLTDGEEMILSEWLDRNWDRTKVLDVSNHQDDNRVKKFLDFDDFLTTY